ncbi:MAG: 50S ribosomal protein L9 [Ignavibacteriae bacterium]|jgi:large subunit ribosomal protein L9|nr:50S ribosomal protein L9 [Ignavibacteriota bacterium]
MKVILKKDFDLLGNTGEIKEVKDGYARNYLIPQGIATIASSSNIKSFEEIKKQKSRKVHKETEDAKIIASSLEANPVIIRVKTAEEGKIYGSVTPQMIHDILIEKGYNKIDRRKITIPEHIKSIGEYSVEIKLHSNVTAVLKLIVEKEHIETAAEELTEDLTQDLTQDLIEPPEEKV